MIVCAGQPPGRVLLICCVAGSKDLKKDVWQPTTRLRSKVLIF